MTAPEEERPTKRSSPRRARPEGDTASKSHSPWTFLSNHAHVLIVLHSEPNLVLREVALRVGITERGVQRIVQELEEGGYLKRDRVGRRNHYVISTGMHLRHPVEAHCTIDQILTLVSEAGASERKRRASTS